MEAVNDNLGPDLLWGAAAIAAYLGLPRRSVYHLAGKGDLPHFKAGETIGARKSELAAWASAARAA